MSKIHDFIKFLITFLQNRQKYVVVYFVCQVTHYILFYVVFLNCRSICVLVFQIVRYRIRFYLALINGLVV